MRILERSFGSNGAGAAVVIRSVRSSTFFNVLPLIVAAKPDGLFGTFGARSKVNMTSSTVNGVPSCHFTFGRKRISQVVSSSTFQLSASPGMSALSAAVSTSRSKMCESTPLFGVRL